MKDIWNTDPKTHLMKTTSDFGDVIKEDLWGQVRKNWRYMGTVE